MKGNLVSKKYNRMFIIGFTGYIIYIAGENATGIITGLIFGEDAVAAFALVSPILEVAYFAAMIISCGIPTVVNRLKGEFKEKEAACLTGTGLIISVALGILGALITFAMKELFFTFYASSPGIEYYARIYYQYVIGIVLLYPTYWYVYYLVLNDGGESEQFGTDVVATLASIIIPLAFAKPFGIAAIGVSRIACLCLSAVFFFVHFKKKKNGIKFKLKLNFKYMKESLSIGFLNGEPMMCLALMHIILTKIILVFLGPQYIAVSFAVAEVIQFTTSAACTIRSGAAFISIAYAEKNEAGIRQIMRLINKAALAVSIIITVGMELTAKFIPALYGITGEPYVGETVYAIRIAALATIFTSFICEFCHYASTINYILDASIAATVQYLISPLILTTALISTRGFKGYAYSNMLYPILSAIIIIIFLLIKYKKGKLPYLLDDWKTTTIYEAYKISPEQAPITSARINEQLTAQGVDEKIKNEICLIVEEMMLVVFNKNNEKKVDGDASILISENDIRLIFRDNGKIFDITKSEDFVKSLGEYVLSLVIENLEKEKLTMLSFNRSCFKWNL